MNLSCRLLFIWLTLGSLLHALKAQEPLSLADAISISLENNYGIQIVDLQSKVAATQNTWGNAGALPRVGL
ncbi:MAG: hypothetical protein AAF804_16555, partial [Bacteroidota bacterium]